MAQFGKQNGCSSGNMVAIVGMSANYKDIEFLFLCSSSYGKQND
jgi:hypothetical protein